MVTTFLDFMKDKFCELLDVNNYFYFPNARRNFYFFVAAASLDEKEKIVF